MKNPRAFLIVFLLTTAVFIMVGIGWSKLDRQKIASLDYSKFSQPLGRRTFSDFESALAEMRGFLAAQDMHVIDEFNKDDTTLEIIGRSGRGWISSEYLVKVTGIITPDTKLDDSGRPAGRVVMTLYAGSVAGGSMAFCTMAFLCLAIIVGLFIRKENLPHLFPESISSVGEREITG